MTIVSLERSFTNEGADLSIEYATGEETFEIYVNRSSPASSPSRKVQKDLNCPDTKDDGTCATVETTDDLLTVDSKELSIFELVEKRKWTHVFALVQNNKDLAALPFLVSSSAFTAESQDNLLLHHVCKNGAPVEVVECVLDANPEAVKTPGNGGFLPLHYACASKDACRQVVEKLLDAYVGAIRIREETKFRLAVHLAAAAPRRGEDEEIGAVVSNHSEVLALLLSYYPEATVVHDGDGCRPIDYAKAHKSTKARWEAVAVLERGSQWIGVSQNVALRMEGDFADRRRAIEHDFTAYIDSLKEAHEEELARITGDLLDVEFDREALTEELQKGKEQMESLDTELQAKLKKIGAKQDRFLLLQERSRMERIELEKKHEGEMQGLEEKLGERKETEAKLREELDLQSEKISEAERKAQEQGTEHAKAIAVKESEIEEAVAKPAKEIEELETKIVAMQKTERLKDGVIKRVTAMAKEKATDSQDHITELLKETKEQQKHMNMLLTKLDIFEHQVNVLKASMNP